MSKLLDINQSYTFSKIFEMKIEPGDLATDLGYTFQRMRLELPHYGGALPKLEDVRSNIESIMPYVSLNNETTRREVMISQVVFEVVRNTKAELRIEYPIKVTEQLQGVLDYLLRSQTELLVIEAKREDLDYGFTQLVAEMIALDQWERSPDQSQLLGAVTTGQLWQFGLLDRTTKHIDQGLDLYRVTEDLDILIRILIQALLP
jgi:hypothetical protein